jgi:multidrug efflux pump subunit AcrB
MLENITRHIEMGKSRMQATLDGSKEIGFTIVSMTLSLVAVFIPVMFMGGILGRLLREFAVTIIVAVLISGIVSLTLTPMLCSRMLVDEHKRKHGRVYAFSERVFEAVLDGYRRSLALALRHQGLVLAAFAGVAICTGVLFATMSKGFLPGRRQRPDPGIHRGRAGRLVPGDVRHAAAGRRNRQGESERRGAQCRRSVPADPAPRSTSGESSSP